MPKEVRKAYLEAIRERYKNAKRDQKSLVLSEFCSVCGYTRKYAIRILNRQVEPSAVKRGPAKIYNPDVITHLQALWHSMNRMCSKKLVVALPLWLPHYPCSEELKRLLCRMSSSSIDRALKPIRTTKSKGLSSTRPSLIKNRIPIQLLDNEVIKPGYIEADTVAHCGTSLNGEFINTLTMTDLYSGWTKNRALWRKEASSVVAVLEQVEGEFPFTLLGWATDNGTEFLNEKVYHYFTKRSNPVEPVRRRAYKKNDNAHVEQKNWTHVRELFGYERFENFHMVQMMNEIYKKYWNPLWNYFTPVMKLKSKERIGGKIKKTYDIPKTPAQRILDYEYTSDQTKGQIDREYKSINPFQLKEELEIKLKKFFEYVDKHKRPDKITGS